MKHTAPPRLANWLLGLCLPERDKEMVLGDLVEEHALLASTLSPPHARRWYWDQAFRSSARSLWTSVWRGHWLKTLGAALVGYVVVALLVMGGEVAMSKLLTAGDLAYSLISLAVGLPAMVLGGYIAASMRPRAAVGLAVIAALMGVVSLAVTGGAAPLWYQLALIAIGPAGSLAGGRIRIHRRKEGPRL
jgi:hypothetical protein